MSPQRERPRVALLVNLVPPYRVALYDEIARYVDLEVLCSGHEDNRPGWEGTDRRLLRARGRRSFGWVLKSKRPADGPAAGGEPFDVRYLHITPGYLLDLIRLRPDAIVSAELGFRTLMALAYGLCLRIPVWVWVESSMHTERNPGRLRSWIRRWIARTARHWIALGECTTEYLRSLRIPLRRITTIQSTVDEQPFLHDRALARLPNQRPVALCVGQLTPRKGVGPLLEALATLASRGVRIECLIAGDGPERSRLEARAGELGLSDVHFLGRQTTSEVAALCRRADFLVFPTLEDVWGLVVNEALWSDLPVLASQYAGCARELLPAENLFDPLDPAGFVQALERAARPGLAPADTSPLWTTAMAAQHLAEAVVEGVALRPHPLSPASTSGDAEPAPRSPLPPASPTAATLPRKPMLGALTGLRFLAAAQVVLFHTLGPRLDSMPPLLKGLFGAGYTGVSLFFVLSGFVLAYNYLSPTGVGVRKTADFFAARVARIYPVYLVGILLALPGYSLRLWSAHGIGGGILTGSPIVLSALTLTQSWFPGFACQVNCPGWSLSVEAFFYLMFPLLALMLTPRSKSGLLVVMLSCWAASLLLGWAYVHADPDGLSVAVATSDGFWLNVLKYNPLVRVPEFVIGMGAGLLFLRKPDVLGGRSHLISMVVLALILIGLIESPRVPYPMMNNGLLVGPFVLLILALAAGKGPLARVLSMPLLLLLGEASYALYILHVPLHGLLKWGASRVGAGDQSTAFLIVYLSLCLSGAILVLKWIEEPARLAVRKTITGWIDARRHRPAQGTVEKVPVIS